MVPLGDEAQVEAQFGLLDIELILTQDRCTVCVERIIASKKSFWMHPMVPLGDEAQVEAPFGLSDILLILTQDRCTVCVERTIGSKIVLDAPDGTPR